ncbi:MAG: hypothetical protein COW00_15715 [Bdellovibrio sp. CG12_big_fil_rev_8_21_14_0_65_39_13]|nr:MAG: hypothetical protein COW78_05580 [Bdellovibrio sp. CG22_combo_CG10-13_8_21_14_all_39_27]PIQ58447.1 MAG: hypothetical protein COW00_15715 [Bdellovibrio sp. CG12_big_fil_rev_8_21_14_0_65_39_13]PIR35400.1 MAG: hypothetical protein COV37_07930 [Bdellovibrio sp. CG11_big_fil_rev_8_21_14_0_20_39_38]PJB52210.1 MAG: hypothetical protein CO099_13860 [Bdellovibrio sp. CG_4_9_14_3_um_filter_39_7]
MANITCLVIIFFCSWTQVWAQDERTFREMLVPKSFRAEEPAKVHYKTRSKNYFIDINGDLLQENIFFANRDGQTYFYIEDTYGKKVFEQKLVGVGPAQWPYRLSFRWLSPRSSAILIHFFEGRVDYLRSRGTSRLDVVTIDNKDLNTLSYKSGPIIWDEQNDKREHYHQRPYEVSVLDLDGDGMRDILVKYHLISRVMLYRGKGRWTTTN